MKKYSNFLALKIWSAVLQSQDRVQNFKAEDVTPPGNYILIWGAGGGGLFYNKPRSVLQRRHRLQTVRTNASNADTRARSPHPEGVVLRHPSRIIV